MSGIVKFIAILIVGLLLSLSVYSFLVSPVLGQLSTLKNNLAAKKTELVTLEQQILAYKNAQSDLSKASEKNVIFNAFLDREQLVSAVKSLERAAALTATSSSLKINEPSSDTKPADRPQPVIANKEGLNEIPYRVTTFNDFLGTIKFLAYLEHLPEFTEISKINLSAETSESDQTKTRVYTGRVMGSIDGVFFTRAKK